MKKIILLAIALLIFIPTTVFASTQTKGLIDTIKAANITPSIDESEYKETDRQVTIYLFWGDTCNHCHEALEFINSLLSEYKDKIKMRSYELNNNIDNRTLQQKVLEWFEINKNGVPFMVIGESTFYGFTESSKEKIKMAIDDVYEQENRYDVFEEMKKGKPAKEQERDHKVWIVATVVIVLTTVIVAYLIVKNK